MRPQHLIDFHVHCFPDELAERATTALLDRYQVASLSDGTVAGLLRHMEQSGVDISVIQPVATKASQVTDINDWAASLQSERISAFGALHPDFPDPGAEVARLLALGLRGVKLQPQWQDFYPDDARLGPMYTALAGRLPVLFHAGNEAFPVSVLKSTPERLRRLHERFPALTIIAAHFGGYLTWDEAEEYLVGEENVYLDTSFCLPEVMPDGRFRDMMRRHGVERVLFATDFPFRDPAVDLARLMRLGLSQDELEAICWRNAARLLGLAR